MTKRKQISGDATWMVDKARSYIAKNNIYAAKSWLLTAKSLFPADFSIQYEEFIMERKAGKVQKCGKLFYDMMNIFSKQQILWEELARIFHAQDSTRAQNAENKFLKEMFDSLPQSYQKELLLKYANHQSDLINKCRISLLVLKRFKGAIRDQAVKLITTLKAVEDKECPNNPLNIYRKMIVCDILPLILKSSETQMVTQVPKNKSQTLFVTEEQLIYYLNLAMEFFVIYAIDKYSMKSASNQTLTSDIAAFELDETISSWHLLHENLVLFASKLNWTNVNKFKDKVDPAKNRPLKSRWKSLYNARDSKPSLGVFYSMLQLHIYTVLEYCSSINTASNKITSPRADQPENEFILVENIDSMTQKEESTHQTVIRTPKKKKKSDDSGKESSDYLSSSEDVVVIVHPGLIGQVSEGLGECLQVAIDAQNFLKSTFYTEYRQISEDWGIDNWIWMTTFHVDALLYQGKYKAAIEKISAKENHMSEDLQLCSLKRSLQLSSSLFCAGQRKAACEKALHTVSLLSSSSLVTSSVDQKKVTKPEGRSLLLLSSSSNDILTYAVQITFAALKTRLYCEDAHRDSVIGHLIVLSQLMWKTNEDFFLHLIKLIQAQDGGFKYELFFAYVTQIDILEEFAFLHSIDSIPLELSPKDSSSIKCVYIRQTISVALKPFSRNSTSICYFITFSTRCPYDPLHT
ncbi:integrator complex subunit 10-like isoform X2 [Hydractinia symbiolongicarpus]|uniref:integrator complex subunit 10-like isoform X2 n=1 Tax=Hydractinia symbiolongicarpus TaxID=13093 RepID=UPI00254F874D|nr:integrator complex subunit 10-like isoform X2 [Hydractinia symbiolongicarpus]